MGWWCSLLQDTQLCPRAGTGTRDAKIPEDECPPGHSSCLPPARAPAPPPATSSKTGNIALDASPLSPPPEPTTLRPWTARPWTARPRTPPPTTPAVPPPLMPLTPRPVLPPPLRAKSFPLSGALHSSCRERASLLMRSVDGACAGVGLIRRGSVRLPTALQFLWERRARMRRRDQGAYSEEVRLRHKEVAVANLRCG